VGGETVSALVVSKDTTDYFRVAQVTLDAPVRGIRPNMPVLSLDGVVGTVRRVAGESVQVQLAVDSGFGVDVVVERTGARGFVRGAGDNNRYLVRVELVQSSDSIDNGDILVTSGVGCRFPKGLPVAKVTKVLKKDFGVYQTVEAEPVVDFSRLSEVLIVTSGEDNCKPGVTGER
jgi:rod shape-determining protein MreC